MLCEGAQLCAGPVYEPQVLIGVRKFARDTGPGLCFPSNGASVCVLDRHGVCIVTAETDDSQLYVIDREDLVTEDEKVAFLSLQNHQNSDELSSTRVKDFFSGSFVRAQLCAAKRMFVAKDTDCF